VRFETIRPAMGRSDWSRDMPLLDLYDMVDLTLARFSRFIPQRLYQRREGSANYRTTICTIGSARGGSCSRSENRRGEVAESLKAIVR
jgi:hypothetical protein